MLLRGDQRLHQFRNDREVDQVGACDDTDIRNLGEIALDEPLLGDMRNHDGAFAARNFIEIIRLLFPPGKDDVRAPEILPLLFRRAREKFQRLALAAQHLVSISHLVMGVDDLEDMSGYIFE